MTTDPVGGSGLAGTAFFGALSMVYDNACVGMWKTLQHHPFPTPGHYDSISKEKKYKVTKKKKE